MNRPLLKLAQVRRPRLKKCRAPNCSVEFEPKRIGQKTCSVKCAIAFMRVEQAEKNLRVIRAERQVWRAKNKPISKLKAEADKEFGRYIRERDYFLPCISCDETDPPMTSGGQWDCGHYRSKGAADHLRYDERNSAKQCKRDNGGSGNFESQRETVRAEYRKRLIIRIGLAAVESLENDNTPRKWDRDELVEIRRKYLALWKEARAKRL